MQLYSRIVADLLVILVRIPVNLLARLTKSRLGGGAMGGGLPPVREPLPDCMVAPIPSSQRSWVYETMETMERLGGK